MITGQENGTLWCRWSAINKQVLHLIQSFVVMRYLLTGFLIFGLSLPPADSRAGESQVQAGEPMKQAGVSYGTLHDGAGVKSSSAYGGSGFPERPLPRDIVPPAGYLQSIEEGVRTEDGRPGENYWQQFTQYDIDVTLDTDRREITASVSILWYNRSPDRIGDLQLELAQNLHAEGVRRNRPAEVTGGMNLNNVVVDGVEITDRPYDRNRYWVEDTRMMVRLPESLEPGDSVRIEIDYDFRIPQRGAGGRMGYSGDNLFYLGYWYPHMVVYDDVVGWHPDPYLGQAEFYHGFADYELTIRAPENWIVMATGELQNAGEVLNPELLNRWEEAGKSDQPVRVYTAGDDAAPTLSGNNYLEWRFSAGMVRDVAFSATLESNWDAARTPVGDLTGDGVTDYTLINSFWREDAPLWSEVVAYQQHAITFLSEMTGFPYPWPHMTAVEGAGIIGGGMEFPMMTIMGSYNHLGADALYSVTAHELAHMWIPMIVSTDERRYSWLDEGNTVFSTAEAVMNFNPDRNPHQEAQRAYLSAARRGEESPIMRRSDYHYSVSRFIVASYRKPPVVLSALRKILGEEIFWEAYRGFINEWAFRKAYPWDFFRTFERVSGRDLTWFWHSWYYETWVLNQAVDLVEETTEGTRVVIRDEGEVPMPVVLTVTYGNDQTAEHKVPVDPWLAGKRKAEIVIPERDVQRVEIDAGRVFPDINRGNMVWER